VDLFFSLRIIPTTHSLFTGQTQTLDSYRVEMQNRLRVNQSLSLVGYEPNHDELCVERKGQLSTPSRKKCGHLWRKESLENSQSSRQAETTSTRPEVIDDTRQRRHRQDHEDGHRYCGGNRRHVIDKLGPVDLVRRPTHSTGYVPTEYIRPATIHQKSTFSHWSKGV
jgi:hypothetical protein